MNKITKLYLLVIPFFTAGFFTSLLPDLSSFSLLSLIFIILFALPSFYALYKGVGRYKAIIIIGFLSIFAILFETFSIKTGFPYGRFEYTKLIGPKLFDLVPISIAFAWVPLVIGSFTLSILLFKRKIFRIFVSAFILMLVDMVIDPGAVALNFWNWEIKDFFYNVPLSNFLGWILSGLIASTILYLFVYNSDFEKKFKEYDKLLLLSIYMITVYWGGVVAGKGLFISLLIAALIVSIILFVIFPKFIFQFFGSILTTNYKKD